MASPADDQAALASRCAHQWAERQKGIWREDRADAAQEALLHWLEERNRRAVPRLCGFLRTAVESEATRIARRNARRARVTADPSSLEQVAWGGAGASEEEIESRLAELPPRLQE